MQKLTAFLLILSTLIISGCTGDACIDADDFGHAKFTINARYSEEEMGVSFNNVQTAPWRDSNYFVNGRPLLIMVKYWEPQTYGNNAADLSAWCPWYSTEDNKYELSELCVKLADCRFNPSMCTPTSDAQIVNAPCIMRKGVGLYALVAKKNTDPNANTQSKMNPEGINFHLGDPVTGYKMYDVNKNGEHVETGGIMYKYANDAQSQQYANSPLYFKILDKYYDDNSGQYKVVIKSGVTDINADPISVITNLVKKFLFGEDGDDYGLIKRLFTNLTANSQYQMAVSALLTIYIAYSAMAFLTGNIEISQSVLVERVIKVAIISALLSSSSSWAFFYDNLFTLFVGGLNQMLAILSDIGDGGSGSPGILSLMIAPQTIAKLFSLLFADSLGAIYIILFFIALYFIVIAYFKASVIYLMALLAIGLIIATGPIFLCFMLFGVTRKLFENWLKMLISYSLQPIILFTGVIFITIILKQEIYGSLGFKVCRHYFPDLKTGGNLQVSNTAQALGVGMGRSIFSWWYPTPSSGSKLVNQLQTIPIPIDHYKANGDFCPAYGCVGSRYPNLPFLDPDNTRDRQRIDQFRNGKFVQIDGLILIFVSIYLIIKLNSISVNMAKFIASSSGDRSSGAKSAGGAISQAGVASRNFRTRSANFAKSQMMRSSGGRALIQGYGASKAMAQHIASMPARAIDNGAVKLLQKQALSSFANKSVQAAVASGAGLKATDVQRGSIKQYKAAIAENLRNIDPTLSEKASLKIADKMTKFKHSALRDEFSKAAFKAKSYDKLNDAQKQRIEKLMESRHNNGTLTSRSLRELAVNANKEHAYREAYVEAHQKMSQQGIGLLGKNNEQLRYLQKIKNRAKENKENKIKERTMRGEKIMGLAASAKQAAFEKALGRNIENSGIGLKYFGGDYGSVDRNDLGRRTYSEKIKLEDQKTRLEQVNKKIERESSFERTNITSPEYLAEHDSERTDLGREYAQEKIKLQVGYELRSGENPIIKGDRYMHEFADQEELRGIAQNILDQKDAMITNDEYISREEEYDFRRDKASETIEHVYRELEEGGEDINISNMHDKYKELLEKQGVSEVDQKNSLDDLDSAYKDFNFTNDVLEEIDNRKEMINDAIDQEIRNVEEIQTRIAQIDGNNAPENSITGGRRPKRHQRRTFEDIINKRDRQ